MLGRLAQLFLRLPGHGCSTRALSAGVFAVAMDASGLPPFVQRTHKGWDTRSCVNPQLENAGDSVLPPEWHSAFIIFVSLSPLKQLAKEYVLRGQGHVPFTERQVIGQILRKVS